MFYLKKAGVIESLRRGFYRITQRGSELLANVSDEVDNQVLYQFPEFREFLANVRDSESAGGTTAAETAAASESGQNGATRISGTLAVALTPDEQLERAHAQLRHSWRATCLTASSRALPRSSRSLSWTYS